MCYCGPAMHALFNSSTRMADDNDFIKSGTVDVGGLGVGMCTFFLFPFQYSMFMNFNMICFATEMAGTIK